METIILNNEIVESVNFKNKLKNLLKGLSIEKLYIMDAGFRKSLGKQGGNYEYFCDVEFIKNGESFSTVLIERNNDSYYFDKWNDMENDVSISNGLKSITLRLISDNYLKIRESIN